MKRSTQQRRTIKVEFKTNVLRLRRELGIYESGDQHCIVAHPGESNLQHAAETC